MKVITLSVAHATQRLADLQHDLNVAVNWKERLEGVLADLLKRLHEDLPKPNRRSHDQKLLAEELSAAHEELLYGVDAREGVSLHIDIQKFAGKPGLLRTKNVIPTLRKQIRLVRRHLTRWPSENATRPYRFKGGTGLTLFDGREPEVGEVFNLTRGQAASMRDRFDEVEEVNDAEQKAS